MDLTDAAWATVDPAAVALFGEAECRGRVERWLAAELSRCTDEAWAGRFAEACPVEGAEPRDYLQRIVQTSRGAALTGIRMRGGDVGRPFVDILAADGALDEIVGAALEDLAVFRPTVARVRAPGMAPPRGLGPYDVTVDQWVCAGRVARGSGPVGLLPVDDPEEALRFARSAYEAWWAARPELRDEIHPLDRGQLDACAAAGGAFWITVGAARVGLLCAVPATDREWAGWLVVEEVIAPSHAGRGLAAAAQRALSGRLDEPVVWGTISGINEASLRTAARVGRPRVGAWWWVTRAQ